MYRCSTHEDSLSGKNGSFISASSREDGEQDTLDPYLYEDDDEDEDAPPPSSPSVQSRGLGLQPKLGYENLKEAPPLRALGDDIGDFLTPQQVNLFTYI